MLTVAQEPCFWGTQQHCTERGVDTAQARVVDNAAALALELASYKNNGAHVTAA